MSSSVNPGEKFADNFPITVTDGTFVKIQNVSSELWACAPDLKDLDAGGAAPLVLERDALLPQLERNESWEIRLVPGIPQHGKTSIIVTIRNLGTGLFAWVVGDPPEHGPVYEKAAERAWKIEHVYDGHYKITPAGPKEDILFWTDMNSSSGSIPVWTNLNQSGSIITLEKDSVDVNNDSEEKRHWYIYKVSGSWQG